jgi:hypothetical protein
VEGGCGLGLVFLVVKTETFLLVNLWILGWKGSFAWVEEHLWLGVSGSGGKALVGVWHSKA